MAELAAIKGDAQSLYYLGLKSEYGIDRPQSNAKAREYYRRARKWGFEVEEYKINLPDPGPNTIVGTGCWRTIPPENNLVPSREIDDYESGDWESPY